jgi:hypothetical protein
MSNIPSEPKSSDKWTVTVTWDDGSSTNAILNSLNTLDWVHSLLTYSTVPNLVSRSRKVEGIKLDRYVIRKQLDE